MDHNDKKNKLGAYYDKELPETEMQNISAHIKICPECQETLNTLTQTAHAFYPQTNITHSEPFITKVMAHLPKQPQKQTSAPWYQDLQILVPSFSAAFGLLLFIAATYTTPANHMPHNTTDTQNETTLSDILCAKLPEGYTTDFIKQTNTPKTDELLGHIMEDPTHENR